MVVEVPPEQELTGQGVLDGHGMQINISGKFRSTATARSAGKVKLRLVGEGFWNMLGDLAPNAALRSAVSTFRMLMHPISITMEPVEQQSLMGATDSGEVRATIKLLTGGDFSNGPKMCHGTMLKALNKAVSGADAEVLCRVEVHPGGEYTQK